MHYYHQQIEAFLDNDNNFLDFFNKKFGSEYFWRIFASLKNDSDFFINQETK